MPPREKFAERRRREGHTQEDLAQVLGVATTTVARWEQGVNDPVPRHVRAIAELWGVPLDELSWLLNVEKDGELEAEGAVVARLGLYASLEHAAGEIRTYESMVMPGLLQTRAYAEAVEATDFKPVTAADLEGRVKVRLERQAVLEKATFMAVIDESVLHRAMGSQRIMAEQLRHLAEAATHPNIDVRVSPLALGKTGYAFGRFDLMSSEGDGTSFIACTEDVAGVRYSDKAAELELYESLFEQLWSTSMSTSRSLDLIRDRMEEYQ